MSYTLENLPLARVISQIESSNLPDAIRFEPAIYQKFATASPHRMIRSIQLMHDCDLATANMLASTSWGLYQIMGYNLIDLGLDVTFFQYLDNSNLQKVFFLKFVNDHNINFTTAEVYTDQEKGVRFAETYNGSDAYYLTMRKTIKSLTGE